MKPKSWMRSFRIFFLVSCSNFPFVIQVTHLVMVMLAFLSGWWNRALRNWTLSQDTTDFFLSISLTPALENCSQVSIAVLSFKHLSLSSKLDKWFLCSCLYTLANDIEYGTLPTYCLKWECKITKMLKRKSLCKMLSANLKKSWIPQWGCTRPEQYSPLKFLLQCFYLDS